MNKNFAAVALIALPFISFAQQQDSTKNHKHHKFSIGVQVNTIPDPLWASQGYDTYYYAPYTLQQLVIDNMSTGGNGTYTTGTSTYETNKLNNNSYSLGVILKYGLSRNWMIRIGASMCKYNMTSTEENYTASTENSVLSYDRTDWQFNVGIEREFRIKYFNLYAGSNILMNIYGTANCSIMSADYSGVDSA